LQWLCFSSKERSKLPRNGSGSYALPEAAFVPNTAISSAAMNSDLSDIGDALTGSLARDGQGGMTAVLPLANTGFTYLTDPNTGMRRTAADTQAISGGGVDTVTITPTGVSVTGTLAVSGAFTIGGAPLLPVGLGPLPWSGLIAPSKWLLCYGQTLVRATYPDLWTFIAAEIAGGNTLFTNGDGSTTFTMPDMRGRLPAGKDNMGGVAASRLTATTMTPDGNTLGAIATGNPQTKTLVTANLPPYTPSGNIVDGPINNGGAITGAATSPAVAGAGIPVPNGTGATPSQSGSSFTGVAQGGTSTPIGIVQPTIITNYIIYAGA
jgi:microcystin-dependent protein